MANIQHRDITEANLHEPKGVSTASNKTVYRANGTGSGTWVKLDNTSISGMETAVVGQKIVVGVDNSFRGVNDYAIGSMAIANNSTPIAMTAAADATLRSNADYKLFSGIGAPYVGETFNSGITFSTDKLTVSISGLYRIDVWADIIGFPTNATTIAMKYRINGTTFSTRKVQAKSNSAGDSGNLNGFGVFHLDANDFIQLYFASTNAGNLTVESMNNTLTLVKAD